ncbi:hypothetical protein KC343_g1369 [Hortaea werneckii]|uniref:DUF985 domain-containing protein n=1 Tax=Hortaea werneckii TaxID=91943 RepID=A0A3M7EZT6_HORWE|nr:hypothetical protein KC338_g3400 [Hortaea werneckii]KAI7354595.1 hypothetical protein KC320_g3332 [Hortaea werneckii]KAI7622885.1 hypothetical protein KC346_g2996 [Hortaea werneckii]KAI7636252.1 hypothetical protein KC343_g1369 [Hortaea werneckii]KAI7678918.1 hypothetical protein KC319_g3046 [Hortaea werneckii]
MTTSTIDPTIPPLQPSFDPAGTQPESSTTQHIIQKLNLQPHPEGGYFVETDRDPLRIPNPYAHTTSTQNPSSILVDTRNAMTSIHYFLTPRTPLGHFHRNKGRTVHTLHRGRGRYVIIHADEVASTSCPGGYGGNENLPESRRWTDTARIETFVVGPDVLKGERVQWIVDGGKYKCSFLLPDQEGGSSSEGLLISETVVPGFEFEDHDFMDEERLRALVSREQAEEMAWMVRRE